MHKILLDHNIMEEVKKGCVTDSRRLGMEKSKTLGGVVMEDSLGANI